MTEKISCRIETDKLDALKQKYSGLTVTAIISRLIEAALADCPTAPMPCPTDTGNLSKAEMEGIKLLKREYHRDWRHKNPEKANSYQKKIPFEKREATRQRHWLKKLRASQ